MRTFLVRRSLAAAVVASAVLAIAAGPAHALFRYTAGWPPDTIELTKVATQPVHTYADAAHIGEVENFQTDDPLYACLNGSTIDTWVAPAEFPGKTVVYNGAQALPCAIGTWVYDETPPGVPCLDLSTDSIDFGYTGPEGSAPRSVSVSNCGGGLLGITEVKVVGAAAADYSVTDDCAGRTLPEAASCIIEIVLRPTVEGTRPAALDVADEKYVSLTGIGDLAAPVSNFTTDDNGVVLSGSAGGAVSGATNDNLSGVAGVTVTFTSPVLPTGSATAAASLGCDPIRRSCTWSVTAPELPGVYLVTARSADVVGNDEFPGPTITLLIL